MSYILDALRKADAERERGSVPGLHAQPVHAVSGEQPAVRRGVPVSWVAAGSAVVVAGALAWAWGGHGSDPLSDPMRAIEAPAVAMAPPPAVTGAPPAAQTTPAPSAQTPPVQAPPVQAPPAPVVAAPRAAAPSPAPVAATPPAPGPVRHAAPRHPTATTTAGKSAGEAPAATQVAATPAASTAEARVYSVNELPPDIRREWPQLSVGGSIYSDTPASRFLIINGQIYHEGDKVGSSGLSLEQIKLKAAVLLYKGYRVGITY